MTCGKPSGDPEAIFAAARAIHAYASSLPLTFDAVDAGGVPLARLASWTGDAADSTRTELTAYRGQLTDYGFQLYDYADQLMGYAQNLEDSQKCSVWEILMYVFTAVFVLVEIVVGVFSGGVAATMLAAMFGTLLETIIEATSIAADIVLDVISPIIEGSATLGRIVSTAVRFGEDMISIGRDALTVAQDAVEDIVPRAGMHFAEEGSKELVKDVGEDAALKGFTAREKGSGGFGAQYSWMDALGFASNFVPFGDLLKMGWKTISPVFTGFSDLIHLHLPTIAMSRVETAAPAINRVDGDPLIAQQIEVPQLAAPQVFEQPLAVPMIPQLVELPMVQSPLVLPDPVPSPVSVGSPVMFDPSSPLLAATPPMFDSPQSVAFQAPLDVPVSPMVQLPVVQSPLSPGSFFASAPPAGIEQPIAAVEQPIVQQPLVQQPLLQEYTVPSPVVVQPHLLPEPAALQLPSPSSSLLESPLLESPLGEVSLGSPGVIQTPSPVIPSSPEIVAPLQNQIPLVPSAEPPSPESFFAAPPMQIDEPIAPPVLLEVGEPPLKRPRWSLDDPGVEYGNLLDEPEIEYGNLLDRPTSPTPPVSPIDIDAPLPQTSLPVDVPNAPSPAPVNPAMIADVPSPHLSDFSDDAIDNDLRDILGVMDQPTEQWFESLIRTADVETGAAEATPTEMADVERFRQTVAGMSDLEFATFVSRLPDDFTEFLPRQGLPVSRPSQAVTTTSAFDQPTDLRGTLLGLSDEEMKEFTSNLDPSVRSLVESPAQPARPRSSNQEPGSTSGSESSEIEASDPVVRSIDYSLLNENQKKVITWLLEGFGLREMADAFGESPTTILSRIGKSMVALEMSRAEIVGSSKIGSGGHVRHAVRTFESGEVPAFSAADIGRLAPLQHKVIVLIASGQPEADIARALDLTQYQVGLLERIAYMNLDFAVARTTRSSPVVPGARSLYAPSITDDVRLQRARMRVREHIEPEPWAAPHTQPTAHPMTEVRVLPGPFDFSGLALGEGQILRLVSEGVPLATINNIYGLTIGGTTGMGSVGSRVSGLTRAKMGRFAVIRFRPDPVLVVNGPAMGDIEVLPYYQRSIIEIIARELPNSASVAQTRRLFADIAQRFTLRVEEVEALEDIAYVHLSLNVEHSRQESREVVRALFAARVAPTLRSPSVDGDPLVAQQVEVPQLAAPQIFEQPLAVPSVPQLEVPVVQSPLVLADPVPSPVSMGSPVVFELSSPVMVATPPMFDAPASVVYQPQLEVPVVQLPNVQAPLSPSSFFAAAPPAGIEQPLVAAEQPIGQSHVAQQPLLQEYSVPSPIVVQPHLTPEPVVGALPSPVPSPLVESPFGQVNLGSPGAIHTPSPVMAPSPDIVVPAQNPTPIISNPNPPSPESFFAVPPARIDEPISPVSSPVEVQEPPIKRPRWSIDEPDVEYGNLLDPVRSPTPPHTPFDIDSPSPFVEELVITRVPVSPAPDWIADLFSTAHAENNLRESPRAEAISANDFRLAVSGMSDIELAAFVSRLPDDFTEFLPRQGLPLSRPTHATTTASIFDQPRELRQTLLRLSDDDVEEFTANLDPSVRLLVEPPVSPAHLAIPEYASTSEDSPVSVASTASQPSGARVVLPINNSLLTEEQSTLLKLLREGLSMREIADLTGEFPKRLRNRTVTALRKANMTRSDVSAYTTGGQIRHAVVWFDPALLPLFSASDIRDLPPVQQRILNLIAAGHTEEEVSRVLGLTTFQVEVLERAGYANLTFPVALRGNSSRDVPGARSLYAPSVTNSHRLALARAQVRSVGEPERWIGPYSEPRTQPLLEVTLLPGPFDFGNVAPSRASVLLLVAEGVPPEDIGRIYDITIGSVWAMQAEGMFVSGVTRAKMGRFGALHFEPDPGIVAHGPAMGDIAVLPYYQRTIIEMIATNLSSAASHAEARAVFTDIARQLKLRVEEVVVLEDIAYLHLSLSGSHSREESRDIVRALFASRDVPAP